MKLLTTALALDTLGPEYRFRTTLETNGTLGPDGKLSGDLILVGRGDPNLSNRKFPYETKEEFEGPPEKALAEFADAIAARGVKEITGDVAGDDSYFPRERYPDGWEIDDMVWEYGAAISAIVVDDNTVTLTLTPSEKAGGTVAAVVEPAHAGIRRKERSDHDWRERKAGFAADPRPGRGHRGCERCNAGRQRSAQAGAGDSGAGAACGESAGAITEGSWNQNRRWRARAARA